MCECECCKIATFIFLNVYLPAAFYSSTKVFLFVVFNIVTVCDRLPHGKLPFTSLDYVFTMAFCVMREHVCAKTSLVLY